MSADFRAPKPPALAVLSGPAKSHGNRQFTPKHTFRIDEPPTRRLPIQSSPKSGVKGQLDTPAW